MKNPRTPDAAPQPSNPNKSSNNSQNNSQNNYQDNYRLTPNDRDPELHIPLPTELIKDLVKRSKENGRSVEVEIAMRIARSLEEVEILETDLQNIQEQILNPPQTKNLKKSAAKKTDKTNKARKTKRSS